MNKIKGAALFWALALTGYLLSTTSLLALPSQAMPRDADIANTKHNLSSGGPGTSHADTETQVCVFCHTPHAANPEATALKAPLWNRDTDAQTYVPYSSSSTQAIIDSNPGGSSKLCLSCHDGTLAVGSVNVLNGQSPASISMNSAIGDSGAGSTSGFTRLIGTDLSNDHPISFDFVSSNIGGRLAAADGELRDPIDPDGSHIRIPSPGDRPPIPLDHEGKVQCTSCHDPHIAGVDQPAGSTLTDPSASNIKFLRGRRFQMSTPLGGNYNQDSDIICIACHDKGGTDWSLSVHADATDANEVYLDSAADQREFPRNLQVWEAACLNCHDTHTVQGSRRLLREGTDNMSLPKIGGGSAIEETCYQCHSNIASSILNSAGNDVPNIKDDFTLSSRRMPITTNDQPAATEIHNIDDADMTESPANLGKDNNLNNRHAECTDCHNPHRVIKNSEYDNFGSNTQATHDHSSPHSNKASGALKGSFGVEPTYGGRQFGTLAGNPVSFDIRSGTAGATQVTKEYQICLKCHSNYSYNDDGGPDDAASNNSNGRPQTGGIGLTPYAPAALNNRDFKAQTNAMRNYTNQAMEFQAPITHQGEPLSVGADGGACSNAHGVTCRVNGTRNYNTNNHRSWHPVIAATGRSAAARDMNSSNFLAPWNTAIGTQTMYCSDCHGSDNGTATDVVPSSGGPWGPHGSDNDFILKGEWSRSSGDTNSNATLCFKCHVKNTYRGDSGTKSGFNGPDKVTNNGHQMHRGQVGVFTCTLCHVAVPHGWKNKAFLVNLDDIGPEVMCRAVDADGSGYDVEIPGGGNCTVGQPIPAGSRVMQRVGGEDVNLASDDIGYNNPPYYINARLRVRSWAASGTWVESDCYSKDVMRRDQGMCDNPGY